MFLYAQRHQRVSENRGESAILERFEESVLQLLVMPRAVVGRVITERMPCHRFYI